MDSTTFATITHFTGRKLSTFSSGEDFEKFLKESHLNVSELDSGNFADIPTREVPDNNGLFFAKTHLLELKARMIERRTSPRSMRALYINTIHGPWIAYEVLSKTYLDEVYDSIKAFSMLEEDLGNGYFKNKVSGSFMKISFYPDLNKYFVIITEHKEDLDHVIYSWNKILTYFND